MYLPEHAHENKVWASTTQLRQSIPLNNAAWRSKGGAGRPTGRPTGHTCSRAHQGNNTQAQNNECMAEGRVIERSRDKSLLYPPKKSHYEAGRQENPSHGIRTVDGK